MDAALNSKTPESVTNSVLAYTLAVQHTDGLPTQTNGSQQIDFVTQGTGDFFVLARFVEFNPTISRTITRVYEINNFVGGRAVEIVPGAINDNSIATTHIETYQQTILEALDPNQSMIDEGGAPTKTRFRGGIDNLIFQKRPLLLLRYVFFPKVMSGSQFGGPGESNARVDLYCNCFVQEISKTVDVSGGGGGLVKAEATIQVTKRKSRYLNLTDSQALQSSMLQADVLQQGMPTYKTGFPNYDTGGFYTGKPFVQNTSGLNNPQN